MGEKILIVQMAKLGDFIQSTSLLSNLRQLWPQAEIHLVGEQPGVLEAARLSTLVDQVWAHDRLPPLDFEATFILNSHQKAAEFSQKVRSKLNFGPKISAGQLVFTPAQNFLMAVMAQDRRLGRFNLVDVWASLAPGAQVQPLAWPRPIPADTLPEKKKEHFRVGFQLGSRNHLRRWPTEHFATVAQHLNRLLPSLSLVLLGSAEERALGARLEKLIKPLTATNLMGRTDLQGLARELTDLDLLITADTGVMHLAAALGTPTLALFFGPAYGPETAPYGPGHLIYQTLACCAPCREGVACSTRQCRELPDPEAAANLVTNHITNKNCDFSMIPLAPGHSIWRTGTDGFGQSLQPLSPEPLSSDEALALVLTEAGRSIFRPEYQPDSVALAQLLTKYASPPSPILLDGFKLKAIAQQGLKKQVRDNFLERVQALSTDLGLIIA